METSVKCKDEITSAEFCECSLLIEDCAVGIIHASFGDFDFVDGFESIQVRHVLLAHKVNVCICSHTQGAQELVIIKGSARGAVDRLSTDGVDDSLKKGEYRGKVF